MLKLFAATLLASACLAQTPEPARFFKLDFVFREVEGTKVLSSHTFTMDVSTEASGSPSSVRSGAKVPIAGANNSFSYLDVGVSIECHHVKETAGSLTLQVSADLSAVPAEATGPAPPVVHQNRWNSTVVVPLQKPTVLFASDDLTSKRQTRLELTATPMH